MEQGKGVPADLHSTSGGDHKQRRTLYNEMTKAAPLTIGRYRNKVQDHSFTDEYLPGRARPGDYAAFHAEPSEGLHEEEKERQKVDTGEDTQVEQVTSADTTGALPQPRAATGSRRAMTGTRQTAVSQSDLWRFSCLQRPRAARLQPS